MKKYSISELRKNINAVDNDFLKLLKKRAELAYNIAKIKTKEQKNTSFYCPEREAQVLDKVVKQNDSMLPNASVASIFREIMSACLAVQQALKIAYLGPEGTFTQEAALKQFGTSVNYLDCVSIDDIFNQITKNNADYGVVPVENSSNGVIGTTLDMLYTQNLKVCGEIEIDIRHQLMARSTSDDIKVIYSHQQSLEQCRRYLINNYPNAELRTARSNSSAAKKVKTLKNSAAIASNYSLKYYKLVKLDANIEDSVDNSTRFLVLGKNPVSKSNNDKTSLLVIAKHESGSLFSILEPLKDRNINVLQLARHPSAKTKWEYLFFIDIDGHKDDSIVKEALTIIAKKANQLTVLGSYPKKVG